MHIHKYAYSFLIDIHKHTPTCAHAHMCTHVHIHMPHTSRCQITCLCLLHPSIRASPVVLQLEAYWNKSRVREVQYRIHGIPGCGIGFGPSGSLGLLGFELHLLLISKVCTASCSHQDRAVIRNWFRRSCEACYEKNRCRPGLEWKFTRKPRHPCYTLDSPNPSLERNQEPTL